MRTFDSGYSRGFGSRHFVLAGHDVISFWISLIRARYAREFADVPYFIGGLLENSDRLTDWAAAPGQILDSLRDDSFIYAAKVSVLSAALADTKIRR